MSDYPSTYNKNTDFYCPLIIFAKAPIPGNVKTRLQPECTPKQSADIASIFIREILTTTKLAWPGQVILATWPTLDDPTITQLCKEFSVDCVLQKQGDLGEKMHHALQQFGYPAAILGSDVPHISSQTLKSTYLLLSQGKNVIGPSSDGGYYLIGLQNTQKALFTGMPWGSDQVLQRTLNVDTNGVNFSQLETMNDIDTWQDLLQSVQQVKPLQNYLAKEKLMQEIY